ncbi:hypothetical protein ABPG72_010719 [Tetrahymena utriculariae]
MSYDPYEKQPYKQQKMMQMSSDRYEEDEEDNYDQNDVNLEDLDAEQLEALLNQQAQNQEAAFDEEVLTKIINQLAVRKTKNEELRSQFANKPEKFQDSEIDLDEIIQKFNSLSAYPELLPKFTESSAVINLLQLLYHENTDIVVDVINFFHEVITMELEKNFYDNLLKLYFKIIKNKFFESIVANLQRLDEKEQDEYDAVHKLLGIIESLIEFNPEYSGQLCNETQFLKWVLKRISPEFQLATKVIDDNKLYLTEILPIILSDEENQLKFQKLKGIESLLHYLKSYEKKDPTCEEEKETFLNIVDCLCLFLVQKNYQEVFRNADGIQLMIQLITAKNYSSKSALRILSYALVNNDQNCLKFVDLQGLKFAFPILMKKGIKAKKPEDAQKIEEQITSIIKNIIKETTAIQQDRIVNKFREDIIKVDRLFELHEQYQKVMKLIEHKIQDPAYLKTLEEFEAQNVEETIYRQKLDEGLSILENVDFIIAFLNQCKDELVSAKVKKNIKVHQLKDDILGVLVQNKQHFDLSAKKDNEFIQKLIDSL